MQPCVGIGNIVWHKPWIYHLAGRFDAILVAKPTNYAKMRFHDADAVLVVDHCATTHCWHGLLAFHFDGAYGIGGSRRQLNRGAFLGREAHHERPYRKLGRNAEANSFGLDQPHWRMLANDDKVQAVCTFCDAPNITGYPVNDPDGRDMMVFCVGVMDAERQLAPQHFARVVAVIRSEWPGLNIVLTGAPSDPSIV